LTICAVLPRYAVYSASCSSGQHFASGFFQIRSHPRHPCLWLTLPLAGCVEDFHLQVTRSATTTKRVALTRNAPCLAHNEKREAAAGPSLLALLPVPGLAAGDQAAQHGFKAFNLLRGKSGEYLLLLRFGNTPQCFCLVVTCGGQRAVVFIPTYQPLALQNSSSLLNLPQRHRHHALRK